MYEECVERLVSSEASGAASVDACGGSRPSGRRRSSGIFFVGTVLLTQLSWLGALAYAGFRLL